MVAFARAHTRETSREIAKTKSLSLRSAQATCTDRSYPPISCGEPRPRRRPLLGSFSSGAMDATTPGRSRSASLEMSERMQKRRISVRGLKHEEKAWAVRQTGVFTRWLNLKCRDHPQYREVTSLFDDLRDAESFIGWIVESYSCKFNTFEPVSSDITINSRPLPLRAGAEMKKVLTARSRLADRWMQCFTV